MHENEELEDINSLIKISSNSRIRYKNLLKESDLFMGASSLIELSGPNKNENQIVDELEIETFQESSQNLSDIH